MKLHLFIHHILLAITTTTLALCDVVPAPINNLRSTNHPRVSLRCETSSNSPWSSDVLNAATILYTKGRQRCQQTNTIGSVCKLLKSLDSASIGICAIPGNWVTCQQVGEVAGRLVESCQRFVDGAWRVGGYVIVDHRSKPENARIIVYSSDDN